MGARPSAYQTSKRTSVGGGRPPSPATDISSRAAPDPALDPEQVARTIALRLLNTAPRSRSELAQAMARKGVPDDVAVRVLDRFAEVGLIDDDAYAQALVRTRHAERGQTGQALRAELRRRGLDDDTVAEALAQVTPEDEEATARRLVARKLASTSGLDTEVRVRRTLAFLGRKGYPAGLAHRLVREELSAEEADELPEPA
ncbi:MAG: recombination regulator RecX [Micrococcales bacterium]|nr:recombination regulator RecX [Micrococcales bacterium]